MAARAQLVPRTAARPPAAPGAGRQPARVLSSTVTPATQKEGRPGPPARAAATAAAPTRSGAAPSGQAPAPAPESGPSQGPPVPGPAGGRTDYVAEGAGAMLALFAYPLLINLLNGGPAQMWGWVKAKFVNKPFGAPTGAGGPGAGTALGGGIYPTPTGQSLQGKLLG